MQKLKSFDQFATEVKISQTRHLEEEKITKRTNEAEAFKALLSEFKVTSIKELTEEQRSEFFNRLRGAEINEALTLIEEGTRGQFGKIDKKGNITSVYTHYDSYPENMLPIIKKSFKNAKAVDSVIAKGDNSGLEDNIDKMNFYGDGGKPSTGNISNISKYLRNVADGGGAEYVYLWDEANKEWLMADIYGKGYDDLYPAFESVSVSVNEAIQVKYKRDAKKVVTVYNNLFAKKLTDLGAMSNESVLGCIKYLFENAMEDANFSREGFVISKNIKGSISTFEVKMPGLGNHFIKIGATTVKRVLDKYYSDIANAAGWSGIGIVEGTALYLEQIKQEAMGQSLLNAFNGFSNESLVIENADILCEATVEMDAMNPDDKDFLKFLKKNKVKIIDKKMEGPGGGTPVITMQGKRKDLEAVLADDELGWDDPDLAEYIEESNGTYTAKVKSLNEAKNDLKVGDTGIDYNDNVVEVVEIGKFDKVAKSFKKQMKADAEDYGYEKSAGDFYLTKNIEATEGNVGDLAIYPVKYDMSNYWGLDPIKESLIAEAEVTSDEEFNEYAITVLQKAFGEEFDEAKAKQVIDGILAKAKGDYGIAVGMLTSSLG